MKPCTGCKNLVAFGAACKGDEILTKHTDNLTGRVFWRDERFPDQVMRPSPVEMRSAVGRCGPDRVLYRPTLFARFVNLFLGAKP